MMNQNLNSDTPNKGLNSKQRRQIKRGDAFSLKLQVEKDIFGKPIKGISLIRSHPQRERTIVQTDVELEAQHNNHVEMQDIYRHTIYRPTTLAAENCGGDLETCIKAQTCGMCVLYPTKQHMKGYQILRDQIHLPACTC